MQDSYLIHVNQRSEVAKSVLPPSVAGSTKGETEAPPPQEVDAEIARGV